MKVDGTPLIAQLESLLEKMNSNRLEDILNDLEEILESNSDGGESDTAGVPRA